MHSTPCARWFCGEPPVLAAATAPRVTKRNVLGNLVLLAAALASVVACTAAPEAGLGGPGLPTQRQGESYPGLRRPFTITFDVAANGCFEVVLDGQDRFVIWPASATLGSPVQVRFADGSVVTEGDEIDAIGALTPTARLVADPGGYWANVIGFCAPEAREVVVLDDARVSGQPSAASDAAR